MVSEKKGRDLLALTIEEIRGLDGRIFPFDSDKVAELEVAVTTAVRDFFGERSSEFDEFEDFHISSAPVSLGDSRTEKQAKYEIGLPLAVNRLEALLESMDQSVGSKEPVSGPRGKGFFEEKQPPKGERINSKKETPKPAVKKPPSPAPQEKPAQPQTPKGEPAPSKREAPKIVTGQPGRILILQAGGDDITFAVTALMDKIGVDVLLLEEDDPQKVAEAVTNGGLAFTLVCVSSLQKGGFSGLTAVITKPRPKHEMAFKLGFLAGRLGAGKVAILFSGEKPQDIPEGLFGIQYLPFQEEGGWQISLLQLLKRNGFSIDANLLFD